MSSPAGSNVSGRVVVAGSINLDLIVTTARLPAAGETVAGGATRTVFGGKGANQAVAARRDGAQVLMIGAVGDDDAGHSMVRFLDGEGIDTSTVRALAAESGRAIITESSEEGGNTIVVVPGANMALEPGQWLEQIRFTADDVVLAQFETRQSLTRRVFERAKAAGATTCLNPSPWWVFDRALLDLCDHLFLNEVELMLMLQRQSAKQLAADSWEATHQLAAPLVRKLHNAISPNVVCTLGEHGAFAIDGDGSEHSIAPHPATPLSATGAGDCFTGVFGSVLSRGGSFNGALRRAAAAASLAVEREGVAQSMPHAAEIDLRAP